MSKSPARRSGAESSRGRRWRRQRVFGMSRGSLKPNEADLGCCCLRLEFAIVVPTNKLLGPRGMNRCLVCGAAAGRDRLRTSRPGRPRVFQQVSLAPVQIWRLRAVISLRSTFPSLHRLSALEVPQHLADLSMLLLEKGRTRTVAQGLLERSGPRHVRKEQRDQFAILLRGLHTWRSTGRCAGSASMPTETLSEPSRR